MNQHEALPVRHLPDEPKALRQWVIWRAEPRPGKAKPAKAPCQPRNGYPARSDRPSTWGTYAQTLARYQHGGWHGLGFVFSAADPYCGIDLDHCRDPETGEMAYWAQQIVDALDSYTEVSPSGRGVHILLRATLPDHVGRKQGAVEVYSTERYFTVTGEHLPRMPPKLEERQAETLTLYATLAHEEGRTRSQPQRGPARHLAARMPRCSQRRWPPPMARRFRRSGRAICLPIVTRAPTRSIRAALTSICACCWPTGRTAMPTR